MRSLRAWEAFSTLSRSFCCTPRVVLSQKITARSSSASSRAKAASYPSSAATGAAFTWAAPLRKSVCANRHRLSSAPKAAAASSYRARACSPPASASLRAAMPTVFPLPPPLTTVDASYLE